MILAIKKDYGYIDESVKPKYNHVCVFKNVNKTEEKCSICGKTRIKKQKNK